MDTKLKAEKVVNGTRGNKSQYETGKKIKKPVEKVPAPVIVAQVPKYSKAASVKTGDNVGY